MKLISKLKSATLLSPKLSKWQIKIIFSVFALGIVVGVVIFTQNLVDELVQREHRILQTYAKIYEHFDIYTDSDDLLFLVEQITPTITFPFISTDENDVPNYPFEDYSLNVEVDNTQTIQEQRAYFEDYVKKMGEQYPPIVVTLGGDDGKILNKFYYTHSRLVDRLMYFPYVAIVAISAFIAIGYMAFSNIRRNEQSKVWVGMSKEAAHQLGTPLSSLLAWIEILRNSKDDPVAIDDTLSEMEKDIQRLNTIATRFSKIGSQPIKTNENIPDILDRTCDYFDRRLPNIGRKIEIVRNFEFGNYANVNIDLFTWVIENLLKNAAESIESRNGKIYIESHLKHNGNICIHVRDTGKGMSAKLRRQVFNPGFTTKKRGWGLGLSLCKRIVEEYHDGRIIVKDSAIGKGTTFQVEIPSVDNGV